jgi:hypothetical protein
MVGPGGGWATARPARSASLLDLATGSAAGGPGRRRPAPRPRPPPPDRRAVRSSVSAGSGRPGPQCPGRRRRWLAWTPHHPARSGHRRLHGRSAAVSGRVSARRPQGPLGRVRCPPGQGTVSTRTGARGLLGQVRVSTRTGSGSLLLAAVRGRSGGQPGGQRTARAPGRYRSLRRAAVARGLQEGLVGAVAAAWVPPAAAGAGDLAAQPGPHRRAGQRHRRAGDRAGRAADGT